jgi:uncharacterized protein YndB with AHSA1/START domain
MGNLTFNAEINASPDKVWEVLFTDEYYPKWTDVFCEGSHAETNWQLGSKVLCRDNKGSGMIAMIEKSEPGKQMVFKCTGEVKNGEEDYESEGAQMVNGATESYTLENHDGTTLLTVEMAGGNFPPGMMDFFHGVWPKALDKVQALAEA